MTSFALEENEDNSHDLFCLETRSTMKKVDSVLNKHPLNLEMLYKSVNWNNVTHFVDL
jgi:hypothetical protein